MSLCKMRYPASGITPPETPTTPSLFLCFTSLSYTFFQACLLGPTCCDLACPWPEPVLTHMTYTSFIDGLIGSHVLSPFIYISPPPPPKPYSRSGRGLGRSWDRVTVGFWNHGFLIHKVIFWYLIYTEWSREEIIWKSVYPECWARLQKWNERYSVDVYVVHVWCRVHCFTIPTVSAHNKSIISIQNRSITFRLCIRLRRFVYLEIKMSTPKNCTQL